VIEAITHSMKRKKAADTSEDPFPKCRDPNGPERGAALRLGSRSEPQAADWVDIRYRV
jgi:hypothetical protein